MPNFTGVAIVSNVTGAHNFRVDIQKLSQNNVVLTDGTAIVTYNGYRSASVRQSTESPKIRGRITNSDTADRKYDVYLFKM